MGAHAYLWFSMCGYASLTRDCTRVRFLPPCPLHNPTHLDRVVPAPVIAWPTNSMTGRDETTCLTNIPGQVGEGCRGTGVAV